MRFASLGSGSKGNATLIEADDQLLLVDCGFSLKETQIRLQALGRTADQLTGILVTHEHGDHISGVDVLARRFNIPVYLTSGTAKCKKLRPEVEQHIINPHRHFKLGAVDIEPVAVPHDANEPVQFVFVWRNKRLGILTDLGHITPHVVDSYFSCDALLLEANHDVQMLAGGVYPPSLKRRVGGAWGHLNNQQSADMLSQIQCEGMQHLVLGHISLQNNSLPLVQACIEPWVEQISCVHMATQEQGFDWMEMS